jgi:hypothetical protein
MVGTLGTNGERSDDEIASGLSVPLSICGISPTVARIDHDLIVRQERRLRFQNFPFRPTPRPLRPKVMSGSTDVPSRRGTPWGLFDLFDLSDSICELFDRGVGDGQGFITVA